MNDTLYDESFVSWFRAVTPYINAFRGKTFVVAFGGKTLASEAAKTLAYDVNLLASLGIRLVLVHGARPQLELGIATGPQQPLQRAPECAPDHHRRLLSPASVAGAVHGRRHRLGPV